MLRSSPCPEKSPSPVFKKDIPSPAPLIFTPLKALGAVNSPRPEKPTVSSCLNRDTEMIRNHQCEIFDSDSNWEDVKSEQDLYPTLDVNIKDVDEKLTNGIQKTICAFKLIEHCPLQNYLWHKPAFLLWLF